jgi:hypothetical protein
VQRDPVGGLEDQLSLAMWWLPLTVTPEAPLRNLAARFGRAGSVASPRPGIRHARLGEQVGHGVAVEVIGVAAVGVHGLEDVDAIL